MRSDETTVGSKTNTHSRDRVKKLPGFVRTKPPRDTTANATDDDDEFDGDAEPSPLMARALKKKRAASPIENRVDNLRAELDILNCALETLGDKVKLVSAEDWRNIVLPSEVQHDEKSETLSPLEEQLVSMTEFVMKLASNLRIIASNVRT